MKRFTLLFVLFAVSAFGALGVQPAYAKATVYINASSNAPVSNQFIYQVREQIRRSASMTLAPSDKTAGYTISIIALDTNDDATTTAFSFVLSTNAFPKNSGQYILLHQAGVCGGNRLTFCADSLLADTDKTITEGNEFFQDIVDSVPSVKK